MDKRVAEGSHGTAVRMEPELYLRTHHIMTYIRDVVSFLLERREEDPKLRPYELLAEYFKSIKNGTHVLFREYSFVSATPYNRASFIKLFQNTYSEIAARGELMQETEYLSFVRLICHDFPAELVHRVMCIHFSYNAVDNLIRFSDFLCIFQVVFFYEFFLGCCESICSDMASGQSPQIHLRNTVVVSIPSLAEHENTSSSGATLTTISETKHGLPSHKTEVDKIECFNKELDVQVFTEVAVKLAQRIREKEPWESCLPEDTLEEVIHNMTTKFTFFNFILALSRSDRVSREIGLLTKDNVSPE